MCRIRGEEDKFDLKSERLQELGVWKGKESIPGRKADVRN